MLILQFHDLTPLQLDNSVAQGSFSLFVWVYPRGTVTSQGILTLGAFAFLYDQGMALDIGNNNSLVVLDIEIGYR